MRSLLNEKEKLLLRVIVVTFLSHKFAFFSIPDRSMPENLIQWEAICAVRNNLAKSIPGSPPFARQGNHPSLIIYVRWKGHVSCDKWKGRVHTLHFFIKGIESIFSQRINSVKRFSSSSLLLLLCSLLENHLRLVYFSTSVNIDL